MEKKDIARLFRQHYAKMYRVARSILYDEQESKDVVSEIFEKLLSGDVLLMAQGEERYLLTSVRNLCFSRLHHQEVVRQMESFSRATWPPTDTDADDRLADIFEFAESHLSERERRIFHLRFADGCSYEEIAASEGISKVAVWKNLSRLLITVRNHFNQIAK